MSGGIPDGIINVLKPPGMTSFDVVAYIRKSGRRSQTGHAGTLDPAAAGVLSGMCREGHKARGIYE